ncbi:hypothetical protein VULLAG_LOCUS8554 [Vulpes lagopus]
MGCEDGSSGRRLPQSLLELHPAAPRRPGFPGGLASITRSLELGAESRSPGARGAAAPSAPRLQPAPRSGAASCRRTLSPAPGSGRVHGPWPGARALAQGIENRLFLNSRSPLQL